MLVERKSECYLFASVLKSLRAKKKKKSWTFDQSACGWRHKLFFLRQVWSWLMDGQMDILKYWWSVTDPTWAPGLSSWTFVVKCKKESSRSHAFHEIISCIILFTSISKSFKNKKVQRKIKKSIMATSITRWIIQYSRCVALFRTLRLHPGSITWRSLKRIWSLIPPQ